MNGFVEIDDDETVPLLVTVTFRNARRSGQRARLARYGLPALRQVADALGEYIAPDPRSDTWEIGVRFVHRLPHATAQSRMSSGANTPGNPVPVAQPRP